jgi:hypothetical protein
VIETIPAEVNYKNATPSLTLTSQAGNVNNIPVSCQSNVTINGSATNCETKYLLEVIETDQWWNPLTNPDYAGAWFNVPVKLNDIDLQWFTSIYGNPLNGNVVNGPAPTAYAGFTMRERIVSNQAGPTANFYIIKLSVLENVWQSAQILIAVNGSCKTDGGAQIAFDPSSMVPMSEAEIAEMYALHGIPYTTSSSQFLNQPEAAQKDITIILAPNPAQASVNLALSDGSTPERITITDLFGQLYNCQISAQDFGGVQINTQNLNSGLYIVSIVANNTLIREKLWIK